MHHHKAIETFLAAAYSLILVPHLLSLKGMPLEGVFAATVLSTAISTLIMSYAMNRLYVVAPSIAVAALLGFENIGWEAMLGIFFFSSLLMFLLSISKIRLWFWESIPESLKSGLVGGIGLLLIFIGFRNLGMDGMESIVEPHLLMFFIGMVAVGIFVIRGKKYATLGGIAIMVLLAYLVGEIKEIEWMGFALEKVLGKMDVQKVIAMSSLAPVLAVFMILFFDSLGTGTALLKEEKKEKKGIEKMMVVESLSALFSTFLGTAPTTIYPESAIASGTTKKEGIIVFFLFLLLLVLGPLIKAIPAYVISPIVIITGIRMVSKLEKIDVKNYSEGVPALLCAAAIPFTYSVSYGFGIASILYVLLKAFTFRIKEIHLGMAIISLLFIIDFIGLF